MTAASNATLYAAIELDGVAAHCIYKPVAGERPLRDFPRDTLGRREVAAYLVSHATGWDAGAADGVARGPVRAGQRAAVDRHRRPDRDGGRRPAGWACRTGWLPVLNAQDGEGSDVVLVHRDDPGLARMAVFDAVIDNADRKGGHVLVAEDGHLWGVDHGLSFNVDDKLRSVLWGWQGAPLPADCVRRRGPARRRAGRRWPAGRRAGRPAQPEVRSPGPASGPRPWSAPAGSRDPTRTDRSSRGRRSEPRRAALAAPG